MGEEKKVSVSCNGIICLLTFCVLISCSIIYTQPNGCNGERETDYCNGIYIGVVLSSVIMALNIFISLCICGFVCLAAAAK
jgi:hypothetical protein